MKTLTILIAALSLCFGVAPLAAAYTATLTWADNSDNELGFIGERSTSRCPAATTWTTIATTPANATTTTDPNVTPGVTYCFRVRAFNNTHTDGSGSLQYSQPSNLVEFTYPLVSPVAPARLTVTPGP